MALIEYDLRVLAWQKSKDGARGTNPPKPPIEPDFKHKSEPVTIEKMEMVADALGIEVDIREQLGGEQDWQKEWS